jgi:hypothetical protein
VRHLSTCLHASLLSLVNHVDKLAKIEAQLQKVLPEQMRGVCFVADFQMGCLTIGVVDAVWVTTLRYELPALRDQLRQAEGLHGLTSIQLKVQPLIGSLQPGKKTTMRPALSSVARDSLCRLHELVENKP